MGKFFYHDIDDGTCRRYGKMGLEGLVVNYKE
jgi:hypothetical protein